MGAFRLLARLRPLRGTALDVFGRTAERRRERQDLADYRQLVETLLADLSPQNYEVACELAGLAAQLRGFGHVRDRNRDKLSDRYRQLLSQWRGEEDTSPVKIVEAA